MKALIPAIALLAMALGSSAYGCDETCQREKAQAEHDMKFPGYLTWAFCDDTRMQFMSSAINSLENYRKAWDKGMELAQQYGLS